MHFLRSLRSRAGNPLCFHLIMLVLAAVLPGLARAEGLGGYVDLDYNNIVSKATDSSGNSQQTENTGFTQRYNLSYMKTILPYLRFTASGLFNQIDGRSKAGDAEIKSTMTTVQPFLDLTLRSPLYTAGARYYKRDDTLRTPGLVRTDINEAYSGIFGWRPSDLPQLELRADRSYNYDKERHFRDSVSDFVSLRAEYAPTTNLMVRYSPSYTDTTDRLTSLETQNVTHVGRVDFSDYFLQNRLSFNSSYNITYRELKTSVSGTGSVDIAVTAFAGLSAISDTPATGALTANAALIDTNLTTGAGINIGLPPIGGDTRPRNIGLDFSLAQEVSSLLVWVDRDLPAAIAASFSWDIYTSSDGTAWTFYTTVFPAPFGPIETRFEIDFSPVITRYIKVVVRPLSPVVTGSSAFPDILVTELQAFSRKSAEQVRGTSYNSDQLFNFDGRAQLLQKPNLAYDLSFMYAQTEPLSQERYSLANRLSLDHRFSEVWALSASVGREDFSDPTTKGYAYVVSSSLSAFPLRTLRSNLTYGGRWQQTRGARWDTNSLFLYNYAELYKGVNVNLSGGVSYQKNETGQHIQSTTYTAGADLLPHPTLTLGLFYTATRSHMDGGGLAESQQLTDRMDASASYNPFPSLYLVVSYDEQGSRTSSETSVLERNQRFQNYALNWVPFPSGTIQFSFAYNEGIASENNTRTQNIGPFLRWNINPAAYITVSYQDSTSDSDIGSSKSRSFDSNLKIYF